MRVIDIPEDTEDTKDPKADLVSSEAREMRTAGLFRFCLGRTFTVYGFGRYMFSRRLYQGTAFVVRNENNSVKRRRSVAERTIFAVEGPAVGRRTGAADKQRVPPRAQ